MKALFLIVAISLSLGNVASSQEHKVIGKIIDQATQKPVMNANITVPGTTFTTFTNQLGFFELPVDRAKHKTLVVSHIGFKTSELSIPKVDRFKLTLEKEYVLLNRVNLNIYPSSSRLNEKQLIQNPLPAQDNVSSTESNAMFNGGINDFYSYLGNALALGIYKTGPKGFSIFFTVDESGKAVDISVSDTSTTIRSEVNTAFRTMPDWRPAIQRQSNVPQHFEIPVIRQNLKAIIASELEDFYSFIVNNVKYPASAKRLGIEGAVYVEFELDQAGNIATMKLVKGISDDCNREVARAISNMPAEMNMLLSSKTACWQFILPVFFSLDDGRDIKGKRFDPASEPVFLYEALMLKEVDVTTGPLVMKKR